MTTRNAYPHVHEHRFPNRQTVAATLATEIRTELNEAIAVRDAASLVLSGGKTPLMLFEQLRKEPVLWDKTWVTLADERWVDTASDDSNERLIREHLLQGDAQAAHWVGLKNP